MEGLALDFAIAGSQKGVQNIVDACHFGEREIHPTYTHIGLTTFSKSYLQRKGLNVDKFYGKLSDEGLTMTSYERAQILKTLDAVTWQPIPSHYDSKSNAAMFGSGKPTIAKQVHNRNNITNKGINYTKLNNSFEQIMNNIKMYLLMIQQLSNIFQRVMLRQWEFLNLNLNFMAIQTL